MRLSMEGWMRSLFAGITLAVFLMSPAFPACMSGGPCISIDPYSAHRAPVPSPTAPAGRRPSQPSRPSPTAIAEQLAALAEAAYARGSYVEAINYYKEALTRDPRNDIARQGLHKAQQALDVQTTQSVRDQLRQLRQSRRQPDRGDLVGDCEKTRHGELQDKVNRACKQPSLKMSCPTKPSRIPPSTEECEIWDSIRMQNEACRNARWGINRECFGGGDENHRREADRANKRAEECKRLVQRYCT
jgi:tetratricopeptide (TPR) repeat protein